MKMNIKFDYTYLCKKILQEQLDTLGLAYTLPSAGEINFNKKPNDAEIQKISKALGSYGIEVLHNPQNVLVQRIKDVITELGNSSPVRLEIFLKKGL